MLAWHIRILIVILVLLMSPQLVGQEANTDAAAALEFAEARALIRAGRKDIVREEMQLSQEEQAEFWSAYDSYRADLNPISDRYAALVTTYVEAYRAGAVTEKFANKLIDDYLDIQSEILDVRKKHLRIFRKALPALKAARFYQLENKIDAELEAQLALVIPLIDPL